MPRDLSQALWDAQHAEVTDPYIIIFLSMFGEQVPPPFEIPGTFLFWGALSPTPGYPELVAWRKRGDTVWSTHVALIPGSLGVGYGGRPFALTKDLWMVIRMLGYKAATYGGTILRTKDGGDTWQDDYPKLEPGGSGDWDHFAMGAGGLLWGVTSFSPSGAGGSPPPNSKVWWSDDQGDNWNLNATLTAGDYFGSQYDSQYVQILVVHPTNPDIMAVIGYRKGYAVTTRYLLTWYTTNGGTSWNLNWVNLGSNGIDVGLDADAVFTESGRLVLINADRDLYVITGGPAAMWSDDYGASWTEAIRFSGSGTTTHNWRMQGPAFTVDRSRMWFVKTYRGGMTGDVNLVYESGDYGETWSPFDNNCEQRVSTVNMARGISYDEVEDALYVLTSGSGYMQNVWLTNLMRPTTIDGVWQDLSDTLLPVNSYDQYTVYNPYNNCDMIPGQ